VFSYASIAAGRACRRAGVPYIVRPLATLGPWSIRRNSWRKRALLTAGARALLSGAQAIHYTSVDERERAEATHAGLPPGVVIPLGIDDRLCTQGGDEERSRAIVSMARLDEQTGLDLLIQSFHVLAGDPALESWCLVIAGDGRAQYVDKLRGLAGAGAGHSRIEFAGWVDGEAKAGLLARAGIFVLPSYQDNFGLSVLEALAAGAPAIVTPGVNLAADLAAASAGWVVDRNQAEVTRALRAAMTNDCERARRGRAAQVFASQYRWSAIGRRLSRWYRESIAQLASRGRMTPVSQAPLVPSGDYGLHS